MTATWASGSRSKRRNASARWRTRSSLKALSRSGRLSVRVATWLLQAYSTRFLASVWVILVPSALPVEPDVFKAPAIILAVSHHGQPFDLGHPAGRGAQMVDDRPSEILLQF